MRADRSAYAAHQHLSEQAVALATLPSSASVRVLYQLKEKKRQARERRARRIYWALSPIAGVAFFIAATGGL